MGELIFHCTVTNVCLADTFLSLVNMQRLSWECRVAFSKELAPSDGTEMHSTTQLEALSEKPGPAGKKAFIFLVYAVPPLSQVLSCRRLRESVLVVLLFSQGKK